MMQLQRLRTAVAGRRRLSIPLRVRSASLSLACVLLLASPAALVLIGSAPDRDERYAAVVTILSEAGSGTHCSATKISPRRFLTAAHCVFDIDSGDLYSTHQPGGSLRISNAVSPKTLADFIAVQMTETHVHRDVQAGVESEQRSNDAKDASGGT